jgi:hypothetical protein
MNFQRFLFAAGCLFTLSAGVLTTGCAVDADTDESTDATEDELRTTVQPGEFKLYDEPNHEVNAFCDLFTNLSLVQGSLAQAKLEDRVQGSCKIAVNPNPRSYRLRKVGTSCGSTLYEGSRTTREGRSTIKITDHRTRVCRDLPPAQVIVEESTPRGRQTLYAARIAPEAEITGTLVSVMGIGGESTGAAIRSAEGLRELILDDGERALFADGKKARVRGTLTTLSGVETRNRPAIDVRELLVCPNRGTRYNCMPGPNVRLHSHCAPENRDWIMAQCAGVQYTF